MLKQLLMCYCVSDFSNVISKSEIKALAEADEQEVVAEVQVSPKVKPEGPRCDVLPFSEVL